MTQTLVHRGPDDCGIYVDNGHSHPLDAPKAFIGLGHRRLSIIDLSTGLQPIHNEDRTIWIVFNGEIYNFQDLRDGLLKRGHRFYTLTDTEVIVHLYEEYGADCVKYLKGMFSFAIWDANKQTLVLSRDRLGKKPLYYYHKNNTFIFASELKGLLAHPDFEKEIDLNSLIYYLKYGYVPDPMSIFCYTHKLPPAHILTFSYDALINRKYWNLSFEENETISSLSESAIADQLLEKLLDAVRMRLVSDVPLGAFLSGGIDSSITVALMAREMQSQVKTFSIGFQESEYNELPYARLIADTFKTDHHEKIIRPDDVNLIENIVNHFDEPFGDSSALPTYYLSQHASKYVKVVLSGDGGDELFAGYDSYQANLNMPRLDNLPKIFLDILRNLSLRLPDGFYGKNYIYNLTLPTNKRFINYISHVSNSKHQELLSQDLISLLKKQNDIFHEYSLQARNYDHLSQMQYIDMNAYLPSDILVKVDRMSMAHGLEARCPFLDHEMVGYVNSLPPKYKLNGFTRKYLLKKIANDLLPKQIIQRKKQGFAPPLALWFKSDLNDCINQILLEPRTLQRGYFSKKYLKKLLHEHTIGKRENTALLWHLLILEIWHRLYFES